MKRNLLLTFFALNVYTYVSAQAPTWEKWDYRYGGSGAEWFSLFKQTSDKGFILGGFTNSDSSGDKTQKNWDTTLTTFDYWIVKIDSIGLYQWDKRFGGTNSDLLYALQQTSDGGYILAGMSRSPVSGDKSQPSQGIYDYWIVKTDSLGVKQWDKTFGGTGDDELYAVQQIYDGGYILGGFSSSDSSGDKTQHNWDTTLATYDYWIVKIDSLGNKQWDKRFGGINSELLYSPSSLQQTTDKGYILGGMSRSSISGDKTEPSWGIYDYWIVKTDSLGIKQWDKRYGGSGDDELYFVEQTGNGEFILGGNSSSGINGDKTQNCWGQGDFWIIKTDSVGTKLLDKDFGGTANEELWNIFQTNDNGLILSGDSYSNISGDKSENNLGMEQTWIIKIDSLWIKQWDKTILTNGHDETGDAMQTDDGCYVIANFTTGNIGGYKTQTSQGGSDYWIVKFCDSTATEGISSLTNSFLLSVFPNPYSYKLNIRIAEKEQAEIILYDIASRKLLQQKFTNSISLNTEQLAKGIYFYEVRTKSGLCKKGKVVKD